MLVVSFFSCSEDETPIKEQQILFVEDLSVLFPKENNATLSKDDCSLGLDDIRTFPVNGCGSFTIKQTIKYFIGETTIETNVTVCCVCAVCLPMRVSTQNSISPMLKWKAERITVEESSSITYKNYIISIAEGDYEVDKNGKIKTLMYKVIVN